MSARKLHKPYEVYRMIEIENNLIIERCVERLGTNIPLDTRMIFVGMVRAIIQPSYEHLQIQCPLYNSQRV